MQTEYNAVYINVDLLAKKTVGDFNLGDILVADYKIKSGQSLRKEYMSKMLGALTRGDKCIPKQVLSVGYGNNFHTMPYWSGDERQIIREIKNRIEKYGLERLILIPIIEEKINSIALTA